jgi:hypothetical protein
MLTAMTRKNRRIGRRLGIALAALGLAAVSPALATFHLMAIQEVFVGPPDQASATGLGPDDRAQYVMLRMTASGQTAVGFNATFLRVEDADGRIVGRFGSFTADVGNGGTAGCLYPNCPAILIGTQAASTLVNLAFNRIVDGEAGRVALPVSGGRVCFVNSTGTSLVDCAAWGNFDCRRAGGCTLADGPRPGDTSANLCDLNYGTPAAAGTGLIFGHSLRRTTFNCSAKENSTDFTLAAPTGFPHPINNAGTGNNTDTDADGLINQLDCADADSQTWWPAPGIQGLTVAGTGSTMISWPSLAGFSGPGVTYDLVRGTLKKLKGFTDAQCALPDTASTAASDPTAASVPGDGLYWIVRGGRGVGCVGTYGPNTALLDPVCP